MRFPSSVLVLAVAGCSQGFVQLPPGPEGGADATTFDGPVGSDAALEAGGDGGAGETGADAPVDAPEDAADATPDGAGDAPMDAADAADATDSQSE